MLEKKVEERTAELNQSLQNAESQADSTHPLRCREYLHHFHASIMRLAKSS